MRSREEERKLKALEWQKKKEELEQAHKQREFEREAKCKEKNSITKVFVTRIRSCNSGYASQHSESSVNERMVCFWRWHPNTKLGPVHY